HPRAHSPDRGQGAAQAQASLALAQAQELPGQLKAVGNRHWAVGRSRIAAYCRLPTADLPFYLHMSCATQAEINGADILMALISMRAKVAAFGVLALLASGLPAHADSIYDAKVAQKLSDLTKDQTAQVDAITKKTAAEMNAVFKKYGIDPNAKPDF